VGNGFLPRKLVASSYAFMSLSHLFTEEIISNWTWKSCQLPLPSNVGGFFWINWPVLVEIRVLIKYWTKDLLNLSQTLLSYYSLHII
jgi:hypothetical protein